MKKQILVTLTLLTVFFTLSGCAALSGETVKTPAPAQAITNVSVVDARDLITANAGNKDFVILDVRTPQEFAEGHIINAVNLDINSKSFRDDLKKLDKNKTYLVYCRTGMRSEVGIMIGATATTLSSMGIVMSLIPFVTGLLAAFVAYGRWRLAPQRG